MKIVLFLFLLVCPLVRSAEKAREIHPLTGDPIYEEDEETPVGISYHVRGKDGEFKKTPHQKITESAPYVRPDYVPPPLSKEAQAMLDRPQKSDAELRAGYEKKFTSDEIKAMKGYVTTDEDGTPVFKDGSFPRPGVVYRVFAERMRGFT